MAKNVSNLVNDFRNTPDRVDALSETMTGLKRCHNFMRVNQHTLKNVLPRSKLWRDSQTDAENCDDPKDKQKIVLDWIAEDSGKIDFKLKLEPICNIHYYKQHLDCDDSSY